MNFFYIIFDYEFGGKHFKREYIACLKTKSTPNALEIVTAKFRLCHMDVNLRDVSIRRLTQKYEWVDETYSLIYRGDYE